MLGKRKNKSFNGYKLCSRKQVFVDVAKKWLHPAHTIEGLSHSEKFKLFFLYRNKLHKNTEERWQRIPLFFIDSW
jgi:hypothetical protein